MSFVRPTTEAARFPADALALGEQIAAQCGFALDDAQRSGLLLAINERATTVQLDRAAYLAHASASPTERQHLIELVVNHETYFVRNQPQIRALRDVLLPEVARRVPADQPIRIWSAGCATGEEAYTLAIVACEALGDAAQRVQVFGTDLSHVALDRAREGVYRGRALQHIDAGRLRRFFEPEGDGYRVTDSVRALVRFGQHNLLDPFPLVLGRPHIVFCQNVMIYFADAARRALIQRFYDGMPDDGLLFLGFSETLWSVFDGFVVREVAGAFVYQRCPPPTTTARRVAEPPRGGVTPPVETPRRAASTRRTTTPPVETPGGSKTPRGSVSTGGGVSPRREATPPTDLLARAHTHADRGELDAALALTEQVLAHDELNAAAYLLRGVVQLRLGAFDAAAAALDRARYLDPAAPAPSFHLAEAYLRLGSRAAAARESRATLRKLDAFASDAEIAGVTVDWLRAACRSRLDDLRGEGDR